MAHVYFLSAGPDGPVKIGFTGADIRHRVARLQTGCPWKIEILALREGLPKHERMLHWKFRSARMTGEWFRRTDDLLEFARQLCASDFEWPPVETDIVSNVRGRKPAKPFRAKLRSEPIFEYRPIAPILIENMVSLAKAYVSHQKCKFASLSRYAHGDGGFFDKLISGKGGCSLAKYDQVMAWFEDNWPEGLSWPDVWNPGDPIG